MGRYIKIVVSIIWIIGSIEYIHAQQNQWSLQKCIDTALINNIDLQRSKNNKSYNEVVVKQSKDNLLPTLNANASQNFNSGRSVDPYSYQYVNNNIVSNSLSLSGGLLLFNGFQNRNTIRQNKLNLNASEYDASEAQNDVVITVLNAYMQFLYAHEQEELANEQVRTSNAQVNQTNSLLRAGKKTETDLLKLESQLAGDSLSLVKARNSVRLARLNIAQSMNVPLRDEMDFEIIEIERFLLEANNYTLENLYQRSLEVMPEVKSSILKKESSLIGLKIYKSGYYPRLSLSAGISSGYSSTRTLTSYQTVYQTNTVGYLQNDPTQLVVTDQTVYIPTTSSYSFYNQIKDNISEYVSLNLTIPILNYRQTRNNVLKQQINITNAELDVVSTKTELRKEIEQAYIDMINSKTNYEASVKQLEYAKKSYENLQRKYSLGVSSSADLQLEFNNYVKAQSNLLQAKYQYVFNLKMLDVYQGKKISL